MSGHRNRIARGELLTRLGDTPIELAEPTGALAGLPVPIGYVGFTTSLPLGAAVRRIVDLGCREIWRGDFLGQARAFGDAVGLCGSVVVVTAEIV